MFFFSNCNECLEFYTPSKLYIMKYIIPENIIEYGKGYYDSLLIPEFIVNRKYKKLFSMKQEKQLKIDFLRAISDLVAWYEFGEINTEYNIYDDEGYEFAEIIKRKIKDIIC